MTFQRWTGRFVLVALAFSTQMLPAFGDPILLSIDATSDELVQIDAVTGEVTVIGPLGFDAIDVDLVRVEGRLFAINSQFLVRVDLHEIDPATGELLASSQVHIEGRNILSAEGLAHVNGQLKIGYTTTDDQYSNGLGDLALDGSISNPQAGDALLDFDALGVDHVNGTLYGSDREAPTVDFYTVTESPLTINVFKTDSSDISSHDVAVSGNTLYAIDGSRRQLHCIDLSTDVLSSVTLDRDGTYYGLDTKEQPSSPCPLTAAANAVEEKLPWPLSHTVGSIGATRVSSRDMLQTCRTYRDQVLRRTKDGRQLISLYYAHGPEISEILRRHPLLAYESVALVMTALPELQSNGDCVLLNAVGLDHGLQLLTRLARLGSPELSAAVAQVRSILERRLECFGGLVVLNLAQPLSTPVMERPFVQCRETKSWQSTQLCGIAIFSVLGLAAVVPFSIIGRCHKTGRGVVTRRGATAAPR